MNRITSIELHNFGPFKGVQTIDLPEGDGVVVIYGVNGKGKTSLLNAVRWALTGEVLERSGQRRAVERLLNSEVAADDEDATCKVVLHLDVSGTPYELTRWVSHDGGRPSVQMLLKQGSTVLNRVDAEAELERLFPRETQQFFLFDGELLRQFESLMYDDQAAGDKLKHAMERMLGVPIVANAARDCEAISDEATERLAEKAKQDKDSREVGNQLAQGQRLLQEATKALGQERDRITTLEARKNDIDEKLKVHERSRTVMGQLESERLQLKTEQEQLEEDEQAFAGALATGWRAVLATHLRTRFEKAEAEVDDLRTRRDRAAVANELLQAQGGRKDLCPACGTEPLKKKARSRLDEVLAAAGDVEDLDEKLQAAGARRNLLARMVETAPAAALRSTESTVRRRRARINDLHDSARRLEEQLGDVEEQDLRELVTESNQLAIAIQAAMEAAKNAEAEVQAQRQLVDGCTKKLQGFSERNIDPATRHQMELGQRLHALFSQGIDEYRERLLRDVEAAATRLFLKIRAEEDFTGLRINDRYGLAIVNKDGRVVPDRSAGYEHLVALSLIGGLQACSTISGPVLMDSPFGRLDKTHVQQVTECAPMLSPQVLLLVQDNEIDPSQAGALLKGALLAEFELIRHSSTHTEIARRRAA